jgi:hypothetical protein
MGALAYHSQVTKMVWNFVGEYRQGGQGTQFEIGYECRCNQQSVAKAMHAVSDQYGPYTCCAMVMRVGGSVMIAVGVMMVFMAVVPKLGFVQRKKQHQPGKQRGANARNFNAALHCFRQQMQARS